MTILCFHNVEPEARSTLSLSIAEFKSNCEWLAEHRDVVSLDEAFRGLDSRFRSVGRRTAITFDDGWSGVYEHAWPILSEYGLPFTVFVIAETLVDEHVSRDWLETDDAPDSMITLDQVREMHAANVTIGSHSMRHEDLRTLGPDACEADLRESKQLLEDLIEGPVPDLAYPKGDHDATVRAAAERAGYRAGYTLPDRREEPGLFAIPRVGIYPGNSTRDLRIKTHPRYLDVRLHPAQQVARAIKDRLKV